MKKFVLAIATGLGVYAVIATSGGSLAARDSRVNVSSNRTSERLLALDQVLYPEATAWDIEITPRSPRTPR